MSSIGRAFARSFMTRTLRAATRGSRLALWQTNYVSQLLGVPVEPLVVETMGDRNRSVPLELLRGRGIFVKEVQAAVLSGEADFAVHSAKDLTSTTVDGLTLACVPERGDPRDALIGSSLDQLEPGARVATGSVRRRAQLAALRPDLTFAGLRGNIETRIAKAAEHSAIVSAYAPLVRLSLEDVKAYPLEPREFIPQVAQGALAVECRSDDSEVQELMSTIEHAPSRRAVDAERSFLSTLGGGCDVPVGAYAVIEDGQVDIRCMVSSFDGRVLLRKHARATDGVALGERLAREMLASADFLQTI